jgi:hypothetical protein
MEAFAGRTGFADTGFRRCLSPTGVANPPHPLPARIDSRLGLSCKIAS